MVVLLPSWGKNKCRALGTDALLMISINNNVVHSRVPYMMNDAWLVLTHWGRVTHICVSNPTIIASDNGLSPSRRQAIIWTNVVILLIRPIGTNFSEILIEIHIFSFKKMHFKWSSGKWQPFCPGLNVLTWTHLVQEPTRCGSRYIPDISVNVRDNNY